MVTMVRNNQHGPTTFSDESTGQKPVVWQGKNDPAGQDVRPVHDSLMESVYFQQALNNGIFSVVNNRAEIDSIQATQRANFEAAQARQQRVAEQAIDQQPDNDMLVKECIGPKGHSGQTCGEQVTVKATDQHRQPPLCPKHRTLVTQFIPEETSKITGGRPEVKWLRVGVNAPQKSTEE